MNRAVMCAAPLLLVAAGCRGQDGEHGAGPSLPSSTSSTVPQVGNRVSFASWSGKVASNVWHKLAVEAKGERFVVSFDERKVLDAKDATFSEAGKIGVWTKADSVTQFDDLSASTP